MKSPRGMPLETRRMFLITTGVTLAVGQQLGSLGSVTVPLALLGLAACGVAWARVVFAFGAVSFIALAMWGWGSFVVQGGSLTAEDQRLLAVLTMSAVTLLTMTSPAVKLWVRAQPSSPAPSERRISQSAPG
ncbi:hypothetical protein [Mumia zhuanghuii]|uniref:Uncharacterized protein n=1 Tax=Mumia zhuanghuii TaxID=2585211 RepID=A0A5C4M6G5_9ACTN|nr:hypothetical protein [Mumia zhuanghuii]TNC26320.1 hypothetical protein FHE65_34660 [Mumia zhuanghuii]